MFSNSKNMINICANTRTHASSSLHVYMTWSLIFYFKINSIQVNIFCFVCFIVLFIRSGNTQFKYHCWPMANGQVFFCCFFVVLFSCLNKTWLNIHLIYTHAYTMYMYAIFTTSDCYYALNERTPKHVHCTSKFFCSNQSVFQNVVIDCLGSDFGFATNSNRGLIWAEKKYALHLIPLLFLIPSAQA